MARRRDAAIRLRTMFGILWMPVLGAVIIGMPGLIYLSYLMYMQNMLTPLLGLDPTEFSSLAIPLAFLMFLITLFFYMAICFQISRALISTFTRWRVRLITSRLCFSDLALMIVDPHYRVAKSGETRQVKVLADTKSRELFKVVETAARQIDRIWLRAGKNMAAVRRISRDDLNGSDLDKIVITCVIVIVILTVSSGSSFGALGLTVLVLLAPGTYWFTRQVLRNAAEIAICDYLVGHDTSEFLKGWQMPAKFTTGWSRGPR